MKKQLVKKIKYMNISKNFRNKFFTKETVISLLIIIFIFVLDRISKIIITNHQLTNESIYVNDFLNLDLIWNTGIGFGLLSQDGNFYYHAISIVIFLVIIFLCYLIIKAVFLDKVLFSLILGNLNKVTLN